MTDNDYKKLFQEGKEYFKLNWDYGKLTLTEKLSIFLSTSAVVLLVFLLCGIALIYLLSALISSLTDVLGCAWGAYLIAAATVLLILIVILAFKKKLIINPIARFMSRLILTPDDNGKQ